MNKDVKHFAHDKLIEQNDTKKCQKNNDCRKYLFVFNILIVWIVVFHLNGRHKKVSFGQHDEVKSNGDNCQEQNSQTPASQNEEFSLIVWLVNVLPVDFVRLGSFFHFDFVLSSMLDGRMIEVFRKIPSILLSFLELL